MGFEEIKVFSEINFTSVVEEKKYLGYQLELKID